MVAVGPSQSLHCIARQQSMTTSDLILSWLGNILYISFSYLTSATFREIVLGFL